MFIYVLWSLILTQHNTIKKESNHLYLERTGKTHQTEQYLINDLSVLVELCLN